MNEDEPKLGAGCEAVPKAGAENPNPPKELEPKVGAVDVALVESKPKAGAPKVAGKVGVGLFAGNPPNVLVTDWLGVIPKGEEVSGMA